MLPPADRLLSIQTTLRRQLPYSVLTRRKLSNFPLKRECSNAPRAYHTEQVWSYNISFFSLKKKISLIFNRHLFISLCLYIFYFIFCHFFILYRDNRTKILTKFRSRISLSYRSTVSVQRLSRPLTIETSFFFFFFSASSFYRHDSMNNYQKFS